MPVAFGGMRPLAVALAVLLTACGGAAVPKETFLQGTLGLPDRLRSFEVPDDRYRYLLWFPDSYGDEPAPLLVFLHGSGDADYDAEWVLSYGLPAALLLGEQPADFPFVVLAPQAAPRSSWWSGSQLRVLDELITRVVERYDVDPDRVYLTGLSMGGYGAWRLATRYPDRFAAVASVSGSGYGFTALPDDVDVCRLAGVPVKAIHGADDLIADPAGTEAVIRAWEERCGADVELEIVPGAGHFRAYERAYRDPAFYDWLLAHTLTG